MPGRFADVARRIIFEQPGMTAKDVAHEALKREPDLSVSVDPLGSLETTLNKQWREGRLRGIDRVAIGDEAHGYYHDYQIRVSLQVECSNPVTGQTLPPIRVVEADSTSDAAVLAALRALVAACRKDGESAALEYYVATGIEDLVARCKSLEVP